MRRLAIATLAVSLVWAGSSRADPAPPAAPSSSTAASASGPPGSAIAPLKKDAKAPPTVFEWNPRWPKIQTYEYVLTGLYALTAVGATAIPGSPRWAPKNALDDAARKALRLPNIEDEQRARDVSDAGLVVLINQALIDNLFVAWWAREHPSVAWQLSMIDAETLAFTTSVNSLFAGIMGRQRPYVASICSRPDQADTSICTGSNRYRSFFSGHTTAAFTLAGLTCIHHAELPLYGGGVPDALACIGAMATASTVGFMRVLADQHYMTDVIAGAAFGTLAGVGMPWLLHYRGGAKLESGGKKKVGQAPPPMFVATPTGAYLMGAF